MVILPLVIMEATKGTWIMNTDETLTSLQARLSERIAAAVSDQNFPLLGRLSGLANECQELRTGFQQRVKELVRAVDEFTAAEMPPPNLKPGVDLWKALSPKAAGGEARRNWIKELQSAGISLIGHGKRYRTAGGFTVSVGFANELPQLRDRWWLGFRDEPTNIAVFLCHALSGRIHSFVVPVREIGASWNTLSRSRGQIKFNVKKQGTQFLLLVPGEEPVDITQYDCNYAPLKDAAI